MAYDATTVSLCHPEERPAFVGAESMPPFNPKETGFSLVNSWWLAGASHAAYTDAPEAEDTFRRVGLELVESFDADDTQGYVAKGDGFAVLAFRGMEIDEPGDLRTVARFLPKPAASEGKAHEGFLRALEPVWSAIESALDSLSVPVWYTGHSLGAALATVAAYRRRPASLVNFASPMVGDDEFVRTMKGVNAFRFVNCCDIVPELPLSLVGYRPVGEQCFLTSRGRLLRDPTPSSVRFAKWVALFAHVISFRWIVPGNVPFRRFTDHSITNYASALRRLVARSAQ